MTPADGTLPQAVESFPVGKTEARFFDPQQALLAQLGEIDRALASTAHWLPRSYEGLADSIANETARKARLGGEDR